MKFVALLALAFAIACAGCGKTATGDPAQVAHANGQAPTAGVSTLAEQERCFEISRKRFAEMGFNRGDGPSASFENNYNQQFDRCFMKVFEYSGKHMATTIIDAHRGVQHARYARFAAAPDLNECKVVMPSGEERKCDSKDEFDEQIKIFMGDLKLGQ
jgi:hypothetical protein